MKNSMVAAALAAPAERSPGLRDAAAPRRAPSPRGRKVDHQRSGVGRVELVQLDEHLLSRRGILRRPRRRGIDLLSYSHRMVTFSARRLFMDGNRVDHVGAVVGDVLEVVVDREVVRVDRVRGFRTTSSCLAYVAV